MNARDHHVMWRPRKVDPRSAANKAIPRWESSDEDSVSSSTSSDSSVETTDDEMTIDVIRAGAKQDKDEKDVEERMQQNPHPSKIQRVSPDGSNI